MWIGIMGMDIASKFVVLIFSAAAVLTACGGGGGGGKASPAKVTGGVAPHT